MSDFLDIVILGLFGVQLTSEIQTEIYFDLQKIGRLMLKNFQAYLNRKTFSKDFLKWEKVQFWSPSAQISKKIIFSESLAKI